MFHDFVECRFAVVLSIDTRDLPQKYKIFQSRVFEHEKTRNVCGDSRISLKNCLTLKAHDPLTSLSSNEFQRFPTFDFFLRFTKSLSRRHSKIM